MPSMQSLCPYKNMNNLPSDFGDISLSPKEPHSAPLEAHSCRFCQSLQAQCRSGPSFRDNLTLNTTAREVLRNLEQECCCDLVALMASIRRTEMPRSGDITTDVLFPLSGSDRIPDEVRFNLDDFILILNSDWSVVTPRYEALHDVVSITSFGFRNALNEDGFQWSFERQSCVFTTAGSVNAGLWRRSTEEDLLGTRKNFWRNARSSDRARLANFQGPTWSWTSINGVVQFRSPPGSSQISFVDADIRLVEPQAIYGAVKSAVLRLRGRVRPATWGSDGRLYYWNGLLLRFDAFADCEEPGAPRNYADNEAERKDVSFDVYLLQVWSNSRLDQKQNRTLLEYAGLVLHPNSQSPAIEGSAAGQKAYARFSRLGHFTSISHEYAMPRPDWRGPEHRGMETHIFFNRYLDQVIELE